jgi:hypothetical protein
MHDFKLYYRARVIKKHGYGTEADMLTNGTEDPEINLHIHCHFGTRCQKHMLEKRQPHQQTVLKKRDTHMYNTEFVSLSLTLYKKIISKWIIDLN